MQGHGRTETGASAKALATLEGAWTLAPPSKSGGLSPPDSVMDETPTPENPDKKGFNPIDLSQLQGFETINTTLLPDRLYDRFALLPGIETIERRENDDGTDRTLEIQRFEASAGLDGFSSTPSGP